MNEMTTDFTKFYFQVLKEIEVDSSEISNSVQIVKEAYSGDTLRRRTSSISFGSHDLRYAYLYEYGPCFSGTVAYEFNNMLNYLCGSADSEIFEKLLLRNTLKFCCLGGGPATEIVAISKVLEQALKECPEKKNGPLLLEAIIVDINPGWIETVEILSKKLSEFVDPSVLEINFSFVECDLTAEPLADEVKDILRDSDVVTMVKFMSAVYGAQLLVEGEKMMKEVVKCLRENAVLFFLDSSGFLQLSNLFVNLCCCENTMVIYHNSNSVYNLKSPNLVPYTLNLPVRALPSVTSKNRVLALTKNPKEET